jgi:hypothetical protein
MLILMPEGGLLGSVVVPRARGGGYYEIYDSVGDLAFEIPPRVEDDIRRHEFTAMKIRTRTAGKPILAAGISIEGKHDLHVSLTTIDHVSAGDFQIHFKYGLHPSEKAMILAASFFIVSEIFFITWRRRLKVECTAGLLIVLCDRNSNDSFITAFAENPRVLQLHTHD